jgi:putative transposase
MWYYQSKKDDQEVIDVLNDLAESHSNRGFDNYFGRIRDLGHKWNRKRVLRVYRLMKLSLRRKRKRRLTSREAEPILIPTCCNDTWSMDFVSDTLISGRKFRVLNIIDDFSREALVTDPRHTYPAEQVVRSLDELILFRDKPRRIRVDNGPELTAKVFVIWCQTNGIEIKYIQPGKPVQNALIERFNRLYREDVLDAYMFNNLREVREITEDWNSDYNEKHPHGSLGGKSPRKFAELNNITIKEESILALS